MNESLSSMLCYGEDIHIYGSVLQPNCSIKFQGVTIDNKLNFNDYFMSIGKKVLHSVIFEGKIENCTS